MITNLRLFCITLASVVLSQNVLRENTTIETTTIDKFGTQFYGLIVGHGTGNEKEKSQGSFLIDLGLKDVIIGDKSKTGWGIVCDGSVDNSCAITGKDKQTISYFKQVMTANEAEIFLRVDKSNKLEVNQPKVDKLSFKLIVGGSKWVLDDWGVLGLAPNGSMSKLLTQAYGPNTSLALKYVAKSSNEALTFDFKAYLNPKYSQSDVVNTMEFQEKAEHWTNIVDIGFISTPWSFQKANLCFASVKNKLLLVTDAVDRCNAVKSLICNQKIEDECVRPIADLTKAPNLVFEFGSLKFEFSPSEYIYFEGDIAKCRFGNFEDVRDNGSCDENSVLAVGNLFYQKYIPVLKFNYGGKSSITFLSKFEAPGDDSNSGRVVYMIIGGIAALIAFGVLISTILKKREEADDQYYGNYRNDI